MKVWQGRGPSTAVTLWQHQSTQATRAIQAVSSVTWSFTLNSAEGRLPLLKLCFWSPEWSIKPKHNCSLVSFLIANKEHFGFLINQSSGFFIIIIYLKEVCFNSNPMLSEQVFSTKEHFLLLNCSNSLLTMLDKVLWPLVSLLWPICIEVQFCLATEPPWFFFLTSFAVLSEVTL